MNEDEKWRFLSFEVLFQVLWSIFDENFFVIFYFTTWKSKRLLVSIFIITEKFDLIRIVVLINRCSFWFDDIIWACFIGYKTIQRRKLVSEINRTKLLLVFVSSIKHISVVGFQLESWWNLDQLKRKNFMLVTWAESKLLKNWNLKKKKEISSYEKIKSINFIGMSISIS